MKLDELDRYTFLFRSDEPSYGDLLRRRDRKRRRQKVGAMILAIAVVLAVVGSFAATYAGSQRIPEGGGAITPQNVGQLQLRWSADVGTVSALTNFNGEVVQPPVVAGDTVYVGTVAGALYAYPTSCDPGSCAPRWVGHTQGAIVHQPTVTDQRVFVGTNGGRVYAFPTTCETRCAPEWIGSVPHQLSASPVVGEGMVYGIDGRQDEVYAFPEACAAACSPAWTGRIGGRGFGPNDDCCVTSAPTVADGLVFARSYEGGVLRAFDATTGSVAWTASMPGRGEVTNFIWPVVEDGRVFVGSGRRLFAFPVRCRASTCRPAWASEELDPWVGQPVADEGMIYLATTEDGGSRGRVLAFDAGCADEAEHVCYGEQCPSMSCRPAWAGELPGELTLDHAVVGDGTVFATSSIDGPLGGFTAGRSCGPTCGPIWNGQPCPGCGLHQYTPVVSGGLLYTGSKGGDVIAYPTACTTSCPSAWRWSSGSVEDGLSTPAIGEGMIFVAQQSGKLLAFAPGPPPGRSGSIAGSAVLPIAVAGLIAVMVGSAVIRRRRVDRRLEGP